MNPRNSASISFLLSGIISLRLAITSRDETERLYGLRLHPFDNPGTLPTSGQGSDVHSTKNGRRTIACALALMFSCCAAVLAAAPERGVPLISVHRPEDHKGGPQTWDVAQDARGILYFANLYGVLTYDGAWWRLLKLPEDQAALTIESDTRGRVALGLVNDLGYLTPDRTGSMEYRSLVPLVPASAREFGDVRSICATPSGFLFITEKSLLAWEHGTIRVASTHNAETGPRRCRADGQQLYLTGPAGLQRYDTSTGRIYPTAITDRVFTVIPRGDGSLVAVVRDKGLFELRNGVATPFAPAASAFLKDTLISGGCRLRDGRLVITTRQNGLLMLYPNGDIEQIIADTAGLPDAILAGAFADREGSLWLPMEGPIVRIDLSSPVSLFDARLGLRGAVSDVIRHGGRLYATSSHGLFVVDQNGIAQHVDGITGGAWKLLSVDHDLLVGTSRGVFRIRADGVPEAIPIGEVEISDMLRSRHDPSKVLLAVRDGVYTLRRDAGGGWRSEGLIRSEHEYVSSVVEDIRDPHVLWCGTVFNGILRIETGPTPKTKPKTQQFGSGEMNVFRAAGRVLFVDASHGQILHFSSAGRLEPDPLLGHVNAPHGFFVIAEDPRGNLWINSTPPRVVWRTGDRYAAEAQPLVPVTASDIQYVRAMADGVVWFASDKGLFRYEPSAAPSAVAPPSAIVRRVVAGEARLLYGGTPAERAGRPELRHDFRRMRIEFAPASYRPGVLYQYRLAPIDAEWSNWSGEPFVDFTTLGAGDYTFRLRARGSAATPGPETTWRFTVLPPWYRTTWAYLLWAVVSMAAIALLIMLRTRALRHQAERLRARVAAQTAQLQQTVELLEQANERLEALSLADDLTGIANRRYFQRALADEWNRARRREHPLALILLDLDAFKELNDRRGHPAGDACLQRVGRFLGDTIRRSGEVVARYGGEEFAILLPAVDCESAVLVADTLREGIERLAIPYDHGARRMTASCGVASLVPTPELSPDDLVAAADRALYAAKHSGRNCVRTADDASGDTTWLSAV
jgi:diguanylate cyclase (GGDEF)-like protein